MMTMPAQAQWHQQDSQIAHQMRQHHRHHRRQCQEDLIQIQHQQQPTHPCDADTVLGHSHQ